MILRVCSSNGTQRINIDERESVKSLFDKIKNELKIDCGFNLSRKQNGGDPLIKSSKYLSNYGFKHGDIVYMQMIQNPKKVTNEMEIDGDFVTSSSNMTVETSHNNKSLQLQEDEIDKILSKMDGRIHRQRNDQYCRHGPSGKCIHCVPLEPYDEEYLEHCDPPIKFISFHAYLRKINGGRHNQGKFSALENLNCKIKPGCKEHLPWPEGICTKCQPSAITLSMQRYRHVDNVMFENASLMNDFLDFWRKTGSQRIGILFGYYTTFDQAPLGIRAVVTAIYEPPQKCTSKSVELSNVSKLLSDSVLEVSEALGLSPVGWIFTDLLSDTGGTVRHYRGTVDTYFLTAQECVTAAYLQNMFPNVLSGGGGAVFGSKFVTVVVTGDSNNTIHLESYQVSNQCMALVRDDILVPCLDCPELGYIRQSSSSLYVPDVFFVKKDDYGNSVTTQARPLPVEFLLVHMSAAFAKDEQFSLPRPKNTDISRFPIENRDDQSDERQTVNSLLKYFSQFSSNDDNGEELSKALCNIHLLWFLSNSDRDGVIPSLLRSFHSNSSSSNIRDDVSSRVKLLTLSQGWRNVLEIVRRDPRALSSLPSSPRSSSSMKTAGGRLDNEGGGRAESVDVWSCVHCTYHNELSDSSVCQMCGLPPK